MDKKILVPISHGTEEIEAVVIVDVLRRAGAFVKIAGDNEIITCSRGVKIIPDILLDEIGEDERFDAIVLPGGLNGTQNLSENPSLEKILKSHHKRGGLIGAICAAPLILARHKIFGSETRLTSHPSVKKQLIHLNYTESNVVTGDNIITSRGPATAFEFALTIVERLFGSETVAKVAKDTLYT